MHLKALEINGFKSFAEKIKIDFTRGITSVVGPNGSGKSNILDAILWVLGEQSYKNIRAKSSTDVIFAGGKNRKAKTFAEVSLIIDNSDGVLLLESNEIKITRNISDSGENNYFINDEKSRLKDIQELFMDTGVGKSAYSVIGQGKVERIISSSAKEIRSIIEEAAGIKKIKLRKEESCNKLEKVNIEIDKISYVEKELGNNLKNIGKQADKALEYKELNLEFNNLKKSIFSKDLQIKEENFDEIRKKELHLKEKIEILQEKFNSNEEKLENILNIRKDINNEFELKSKENTLFKENLELLINEKIRLTERLSSLKKDIWGKNENLISLEKKTESKKEVLYELEVQEKELNKYIESEEHNYEEENLYIDDLNDKIYKVEDEIKKSKENILDLEVERVKFLNDIEDSNKKIKNLEKRLNELSNKETILLEEIENSKKNHKIIEDNYNSLESNNTNLKDLRIEKTQEKKETESKLYELKNKKDEEEIKLKNKINKLDSLKKYLDNNEGYFKSVKLIMENKIEGVIGPVLSLIEIPEKFQKAIEISLGNSLQDIIVENGNTAKKAIDFLKNNKGGRASFLPLDRLKLSGLSYNLKNDKVFGTANELIKYPLNIRKAIDFLFSKILIVEDIDTALSVQEKGTFKGTIVSLEGDIFSTSGKISGGEQVKSASSVIFEKKKEIQNLETEVSDLDKNFKSSTSLYVDLEKNLLNLNNILENINEDQDKLRNLIEEKIKTLNNASLDFSQKEKHLQIIQYEKKELLENLAEYNNKANNGKIEIEVLGNKLELIRKNIEDLDKEKMETKLLLDNLQKENSGKKIIYATRNEEKKQISRNIESLSKEIKEFYEELNKINLHIENSSIEKIKCEERIYELETLIEQNNLDYNNKLEFIQNLRVEISNLENNEKKLIVEIKDIEREIVKEEAKFVAIIEKVEKLKNSIEDLKNKIEELNEFQLINLEIDLSEAKEELKNLENKIKSLGFVNLLALEEFESAKEKFSFIHEQKTDLVHSKKNLENLIVEIEQTIKNTFYDAFKEIDKNFNYMCKEILNNSVGNLKLIDENNLLESGIELMVKYMNKKSQSLSLLSGGEKSMVAVALIMAIFMYKPSPFTFFDEIEAALDETNTKRLISKLKDFTDKSQFILITHNKYTMKESDTLYGVTMNKEIGESKILSVKL